MKLKRNWRNFLVINEHRYSKKEVEYRLSCKVSDTSPYVEVGYILIKKVGKYNFVKVVSVNKIFRGKGCGTMLYEHAINKLGNISTNYHMASSLAQRVWRRLIKKYEHRDDFFSGVLTVFRKDIDT